ncbi:MAG: M67 family metallopeptidase [Oscillospiraceae bacterium]|jgi:proteasome lid subunit RPN8/RPN11|nr:M67 family metallopeptidase [Oscillospiraceae bacterium]
MRIHLNYDDFNKIVDHAKSALPEEACGLIAGRAEADEFYIEQVYPLTNIDHSSEHFSIDPREQLAAVKDMRAKGIAPLGNFHSHPETPARPSDEDIRLAQDPKALYLILSLALEEPCLRAFRIEGGKVRGIAIELEF